MSYKLIFKNGQGFKLLFNRPKTIVIQNSLSIQNGIQNALHKK